VRWLAAALLLLAAAAKLGGGHEAATIVWFFLLGLGSLGGAYWIALARHPFRACRACRGTGRHRGTWFRWGHRQCVTCGGQGRHRRWGTQQFYPNRRTWGERMAAQAGRRPARPQ
jgi:hypothetical protein